MTRFNIKYNSMNVHIKYKLLIWFLLTKTDIVIEGTVSVEK